MKSTLNKLTTKLLTHLDIKPKQIDIKTKDNVLYLNLDLTEDDTGMLIGYHGDTISSLQLLLSLMFYKQSGSWSSLVVDIGDYRQKRSDYLNKLAQDTANKVIESGQPMALYNLNPFERRLVHTALSDQDQVVTQSEGEAKNRHLIIKPQSLESKNGT